MKMSRTPAFTLVEMIIVSMIIAILAISMSVRFQGSKQNAEFDSLSEEILIFFQKARGLSQANVVVDGDEEGTAYYYIKFYPDLADNTLYLYAYGESDTILEVDSLELAEGYTLRNADHDVVSVIYTPPYGEVCFNIEGDAENPPDGCTDIEDSTISFTLQDSEGEYSQNFEVSRHGGFIQEVE